MPYLQRGRKTWWGSFYALDGSRRRISLGTSNPRSAADFERALRQVAERPEWYDLIEAVEQGEASVPELYRAWSGSEIPALRSKLAERRANHRDVQLDNYLTPWAQWCARQRDMTPAVVAQYRQRVASLLAQRKPFRLSHLRPDVVQDWFGSLTVGPTSLPRYAAALRSFVKFLRERGVLADDPLEGVAMPAAHTARTRHASLDELATLYTAIPKDTERQRKGAALILFCHASGAEVNAALSLCWDDVNTEKREVFLRGTKNQYRQRWARVADWYWPTIERMHKEAQVQYGPNLAGRRVFHPLKPGHSGRCYVTALNLEACRAAGIQDLHVHDGRHTFAVRLLKAGAPAEVVAQQLGHNGTAMVVKVYGPWIVSAIERDTWERKAQELQRQGAA